MGTKAEVSGNHFTDKVNPELEKKRAEAIKRLKKLKGSASPSKLTEEERREIRERIALELTPEKSDEILKEFGLL